MYYYELKNGKRLCYSTKGRYMHPEVEESRCKHQGYVPTHGKYWRELESEQHEKLGNGDELETRKVIIKKVSQGRKDLKCQECEALFIWKGYRVWAEKTIKEGKVVAGLFRMGGEDKTYMVRWFKRKKQQTKFIKNYMSKHNG